MYHVELNARHLITQGGGGFPVKPFPCEWLLSSWYGGVTIEAG